ncbi:MAG: PAS domain S-box protein [Thermodesulfobacteriota bacterium]
MNLKDIDPYKVIDFKEWQNILNILSKISGAKSAAITKIDFPCIQVLKINATPDVPLCEGMSIELANHYCEAVFHSQESVLIANALKHEQWKNAPEIRHGLVSYLGFPLFLPDGGIFGTLCIHNDQETAYSQEIYYMMHQFKKIIEAHFALAEQTKQLKESEEARRLSEARFRSLIENSPDAIFVQTQGHFTYLNSAAVSLFGAQNENDLLGKPVIERFHPDFHKEIQERIHKINTEKKQVSRLEEVYLKLNGTQVDVEVSAVPIVYEGHDGVLVFARDVSERKQLEQLKKDIDRITHHDLKTPLNGVMGLTQLLLSDESLDDNKKELLQHIETSGQQMIGIINMSSALYQMEKDEYQFVPASVDIVPIIRNIEYDLSDFFKSVNGKLLVEILSEQDSYDSFLVLGEKSLCYTMLSNLIKNAAESIQDGEQVHVCLEAIKPSKAIISIHNPGVIPESIQNIFGQKYVTFGKYKGTGLGVYSARLTAKTMKGDFNWSTSSESGTYIYIELPKPTY